MSGKLVSFEDALDGCERILADELKTAAAPWYMIGKVDEAYAKHCRYDQQRPAASQDADASHQPVT
jgi:F-type H+-transporting ATPase subunit beta